MKSFTDIRMPVWFRELLTEADNTTPDFLRILAIVGIIVFLCLAVWNHATFDPLAFGTGFGAVLLAAGGAVRLNEGPAIIEPKGPTTTIASTNTTVNP